MLFLPLFKNTVVEGHTVRIPLLLIHKHILAPRYFTEMTFAQSALNYRLSQVHQSDFR